MKTITLTQNTPEWLTYRKNRIGGSDAPSIMQCGFKTPYQLFLEKLGLHETPMNDMMKRGQELEPYARQKFIDMTGIEVNALVVEHDDRSWQIASLDGIDKDHKVIVEIKTGGGAALERAQSGKISDGNYCQIQHQLEVTGLSMCFYFFFDGHNGYPIEIKRDDKYIQRLNEEEKRFWDDLQDFTPPKLTSKDYVEHVTPGRIRMAAEWLELNERMKADSLREKDLRDAMIADAGMPNTIGGGLQISKVVRQGAVDYKAIDALKEVDLNAYRKAPIEFWRVTKT